MFLSDWHCYESPLQQLPLPQLQQIPFPGLPRQVTLFNLIDFQGPQCFSFSYNISRGLNVSLSTDDPLQFHFTKVQ